MLQNIGLKEIIILVLVVVIIAGTKHLNQAAHDASEAAKELRQAKKEAEEKK